jgi:hypothetical protein
LYPICVLPSYAILENAMPSFIPVPNTVCAHLRGTLNGQQVENTLYFHSDGTWELSGMGALAAALGLWYRTTIVASISNEYQYRECRIEDLTASDGLVVTDSSGAGQVGGVTENASSNQAAFCVKFNTNRRGRSYRGRNYIPGIPEGQVAGGKISVGLAGYMIGFFGVLDGYSGLFGAEWSVVSRFADGAPRAYGISTPVVSASYTTLALASQRGRRPE